MNSSPSPESKSPAIALYTCYHKPTYLISNDIVVPIHVGAALSEHNLSMQRDSEGDSISHKNPFFCELTATYWIWKNATADIVGLFHYRRFVNLRTQLRKALIPDDSFLESHGITHERVQEIMGRYDVILPGASPSDGQTIRQFYAESHVGSDLELCLELIAEKYPDMVESAREAVDNPHSLGYFGNILICRKPLFDEYAAWLFDILFEVERRIHADVLTRDAYQQRVYGFLSERLMAVFIGHKVKTAGLRVCEVPVLQVLDDRRKFRHYLFRRWKHLVLKALGFNKTTWVENIKTSI